MGLPKPLNLYIQKLIMKVDTPISSVPLCYPECRQDKWGFIFSTTFHNYIDKYFHLHLKQGYEVLTSSFPHKRVFDIMLWKNLHN